MRLNPIIYFDQSLMPNYKSVTYMLENNLVIEPDFLIKTNGTHQHEFNSKCNAFCYLRDLEKKKIDGYAIIRVKDKAQAKFLEWKITNVIKGKHLFIKHWNQKEKIDPQTYFNDLREGVLIVVIVQKKGAMGNSIPTGHIRMMYDYSPSASLSTIAQGLLGRSCGHGKKKDYFPVFTHVKHAEAYSLFEQGKMEEFAEYLHKNKIAPSARAKVKKTNLPIVHGTITPPAIIKSRAEARLLVKQEIEKSFGQSLQISGTINTRFLSAQNDPTQRKWYLNQIAKGINPVASRSLEKKLGKTTLFYDDRSNTIYYGIRTDGSTSFGIKAGDNSFYTTF